jgi:hypothetical protein
MPSAILRSSNVPIMRTMNVGSTSARSRGVLMQRSPVRSLIGRGSGRVSYLRPIQSTDVGPDADLLVRIDGSRLVLPGSLERQ